MSGKWLLDVAILFQELWVRYCLWSCCTYLIHSWRDINNMKFAMKQGLLTPLFAWFH